LQHEGVQTARQPAVVAALAQSRFARLPAEVVEALTADALLLEIPVGGVPVRQGHEPNASVIVSGLIRAFHTTADGRQMTVRYARRGELLGIATLYRERSGALGLQALTQCRLLVLRPAVVRAIAERDVRVANLFAEEIAHRLITVLDELAGNTFGSMRQRVVRHLLDLAAGATGQRMPLVARLSQQDLADAVGSVREVVVRLLRDLREEGLIRTGRDEIELLDPDRLHGETFPRAY
jgi:CRP/FNR family transcriptional regulator